VNGLPYDPIAPNIQRSSKEILKKKNLFALMKSASLMAIGQRNIITTSNKNKSLLEEK